MPDSIGKGSMSLRCRLTDVEIYDRREALVKKTAKRGRLEGELDAWKARKKEEQKVLEGEVTVIGADCIRLARTIEDGEERRDVKVEYWLRAGQVDTVRLDTGEVVTSRPGLEHELQLVIPGAEPENEATFAQQPCQKIVTQEGVGCAVHDEPWPCRSGEEPEAVVHEESHPDGEEPEDDAPPPARADPAADADADHEMEWDGVGGAGAPPDEDD